MRDRTAVPPSFVRTELLEALRPVHGVLTSFETPGAPVFGDGWALSPLGVSLVSLGAEKARDGWLRLDRWVFGDGEPDLRVPGWVKESLAGTARDLHLTYRAILGILHGPAEGSGREAEALTGLLDIIAGRYREASEEDGRWAEAERWAQADPERRAVDDAISDLLRDVGGVLPEEA